MILERFLIGFNKRARALMQELVPEKARWIALGILILYLAAFCVAASRRFFWFDELGTFYLASLPSYKMIFRALSDGVDLTPPLFHLTTRAVVSLFGPGHVVTRLPALFGFGLMITCLYRFVSRRAPAMYGIIAMLLPFMTGAQGYAIEARPYGLMCGLCAMALVCWQSATLGFRKKLALFGLAFSLAAAVSIHYYAGLVLLAVGVGELIRDVRSRKPDPAVWVSLVVGFLPLPFHLPWIRMAGPYLHDSWAPPSLLVLGNAYSEMTSPTLLAVALVVAGSAMLFSRDRFALPSQSSVPLHEWAAAGVLLASPLVVWLVAVLETGSFPPRYSILAVLGFSIVTSFLLSSAERELPAAGLLFLSLLAVLFVSLKLLMALDFAAPAPPAPVPDLLRARASEDLPVVIDSPLRFLEVAHYAPPELGRRIYYLADPETARREGGSPGTEIVLLALRHWAPIHVENYQAFLATHRQFLLYWRPAPLGWLLHLLSRDGARIQIQKQQTDQFLFLVSQG